MSKIIYFLITVLFFSSCALPKKDLPSYSPEVVFDQICGYGSQVNEVSGFISLRMNSPDVSGQYSAAVKASLKNGLDMTVTHLFGGTLAEIKVRKNSYMVKIPSKNQILKGGDHWGGIPLRWALPIILGRFPCPESGASNISLNYEGENFQILSHDEEFHYTLKSQKEGLLWPESLRWVKKIEPKTEINFKFFDPEDQTGSPRRWEAKSTQGEVRFRWQNKDSK